MQDADYSEVDTTADEFDAMWEKAKPVETETLVRFVEHSNSAAVARDIKVDVNVSWADARGAVESESAYARLVAG